MVSNSSHVWLATYLCHIQHSLMCHPVYIVDDVLIDPRFIVILVRWHGLISHKAVDKEMSRRS